MRKAQKCFFWAFILVGVLRCVPTQSAQQFNCPYLSSLTPLPSPLQRIIYEYCAPQIETEGLGLTRTLSNGHIHTAQTPIRASGIGSCQNIIMLPDSYDLISIHQPFVSVECLATRKMVQEFQSEVERLKKNDNEIKAYDAFDLNHYTAGFRRDDNVEDDFAIDDCTNFIAHNSWCIFELRRSGVEIRAAPRMIAIYDFELKKPIALIKVPVTKVHERADPQFDQGSLSLAISPNSQYLAAYVNGHLFRWKLNRKADELLILREPKQASLIELKDPATGLVIGTHRFTQAYFYKHLSTYLQLIDSGDLLIILIDENPRPNNCMHAYYWEHNPQMVAQLVIQEKRVKLNERSLWKNILTLIVRGAPTNMIPCRNWYILGDTTLAMALEQLPDIQREVLRPFVDVLMTALTDPMRLSIERPYIDILPKYSKLTITLNPRDPWIICHALELAALNDRIVRYESLPVEVRTQGQQMLLVKSECRLFLDAPTHLQAALLCRFGPYVPDAPKIIEASPASLLVSLPQGSSAPANKILKAPLILSAALFVGTLSAQFVWKHRSKFKLPQWVKKRTLRLRSLVK